MKKNRDKITNLKLELGNEKIRQYNRDRLEEKHVPKVYNIGFFLYIIYLIELRYKYLKLKCNAKVFKYFMLIKSFNVFLFNENRKESHMFHLIEAICFTMKWLMVIAL